MFHAPLIRTELLRLGRQTRLYMGRTTVMAAVIMMILAILGVEQYAELDTALLATPPSAAKVFFYVVLICQVFAASVVAPGLAAASFIVEKEERTLGLLLMADLSGRDVVLSKYCVVLAQMAALILAVLPFGAFVVLFGETTWAGFLAQTGMLLIWGAAVAALGTLFAVIFNHSNAAAGLSLVCILIWLIATGIIDGPVSRWTFHTNPIATAWLLGTDPGYLTAAAPTVIPCVLLIVFTLVWAVRLLPGRVHETAGETRARGLRISLTRFIGRRLGPVFGFTAALVGNIGFAGRHFVLQVLSYGALVVSNLVPFLGWWLVFLVIYREITLSIDQMKRQGVLADLAVAPPSDRALGRGFWTAHLTSTKAYLSAIVVGFVIYRYVYGAPLEFCAVYLPIAVVQYVFVVALACFAGTFALDRSSIGVLVLSLIGWTVYLVPVMPAYTQGLYDELVEPEDLERFIGLTIDGWTGIVERYGAEVVYGAYALAAAVIYVIGIVLLDRFMGRRVRACVEHSGPAGG